MTGLRVVRPVLRGGLLLVLLAALLVGTASAAVAALAWGLLRWLASGAPGRRT